MLVVIFLVLAALLRALLIPVILIVTVVLSFAATLGVSGFFFTHVFGFAGGADQSFPLFAFVFLVALGIDYNIFLMTRVREETGEFGTRAGVLRGLAVTGGVITSAGIVLAATFAVLGILPLVFLAEIGFAVPSACCSIRSSCAASWCRHSLTTSGNVFGGRPNWPARKTDRLQKRFLGPQMKERVGSPGSPALGQRCGFFGRRDPQRTFQHQIIGYECVAITENPDGEIVSGPRSDSL